MSEINIEDVVAQPKANSKSKIFLSCKLLFLTYPGHINAQEYLDWFNEKLPKTNKIKFYTIAHEIGYDDMETHPEGYKHTHMSIQLEKQYQISTARTLDYEGIHGDYLRTKSQAAAHRYLSKGDIDIEKCLAEGIDHTIKETKHNKLPRRPPVLFTNVNDLLQFTKQDQQHEDMLDLMEYLKSCKTTEEALSHESNTSSIIANNIIRLWGDLRVDYDYSDGEHMRRAMAVKLYPWQQDIYDKLSDDNVDNRLVTWIYNFEGNIGKSTLVSVLRKRMEGVLSFSDTSKVGDMAYVLFDYCARKHISPRVILFDLSRTRVDNHSIYTFLEQVKNGEVFSSKYKSAEFEIRVPHVVVFSNFFPDIKAFTKDRWNLVEINKDPEGDGHIVSPIHVDDFQLHFRAFKRQQSMIQERNKLRARKETPLLIKKLLAKGFTQEEIDKTLEEEDIESESSFLNSC